MSNYRLSCSYSAILSTCALLTFVYQPLANAKPIAKTKRVTTKKPKESKIVAAPQLTKLEPAKYEFETPHAANGAPYPGYVALFVKGTGFKPGATILLDGMRISTAFRSPSLLEGAIAFRVIQAVSNRAGGNSPDGFIGTARITVLNPASNGGTSKSLPFVVRATPIG